MTCCTARCWTVLHRQVLDRDVSPMSCRHCCCVPLRRTYASVALLGTEELSCAVERLESRGIVPCVTAFCGECNRLSAIVYDGDYVHGLALWERLGKYLSD